MPESEIIESLKTLYEKGIEDDVTYMVNITTSDMSKDFTAFSKQINQHFPSYFTKHRHVLIDTCVRRAKSLKEQCNVVFMAAETGQLTKPELEQILNNIAKAVNIIEIPESQKEIIAMLMSNCTKIGLSPPQRVILASFNLHLSELSKNAQKLFTSEKKVMQSVSELMQLQPLDIDQLELFEKNEYLAYISRFVATLTVMSGEYSLQNKLFKLDLQEQQNFNEHVLNYTSKFRRKV